MEALFASEFDTVKQLRCSSGKIANLFGICMMAIDHPRSCICFNASILTTAGLKAGYLAGQQCLSRVSGAD